MGKQMEGDNRQRRRLARLARKLGKRPSELQATTGASKQREHEERDEDHETKLMRRRQGKQASVGGFGGKQSVPPGRAARPLAPSSVAPISTDMDAPCVLPRERPSRPGDERFPAKPS